MDSPIPKHVLLVEDNLSLGAMLLSTLQTHHFQTAAVTGGEAALRSLENEHIDLILLDILLPRMNGLDFLKEIRSRGFNQPVVVVSNMDDQEVKEKALSLGASYYLVKANTTPKSIIDLLSSFLTENSQVPPPASTDGGSEESTL